MNDIMCLVEITTLLKTIVFKVNNIKWKHSVCHTSDMSDNQWQTPVNTEINVRISFFFFKAVDLQTRWVTAWDTVLI
jgi:hypothetical protein